jgi:hypothetical protein
MLNFEKYKTTEERNAAFREYCLSKNHTECTSETVQCPCNIRWMVSNDDGTISNDAIAVIGKLYTTFKNHCAAFLGCTGCPVCAFSNTGTCFINLFGLHEKRRCERKETEKNTHE